MVDLKSNTIEKSCLFLLYIISQESIKKKEKANGIYRKVVYAKIILPTTLGI